MQCNAMQCNGSLLVADYFRVHASAIVALFSACQVLLLSNQVAC